MLAALGGCATRESIPIVNVAANPSGIRIANIRKHGPKSLLGLISEPPDVPSGVVISLEREEPLHSNEPRYFIPASGRLEIVSVENPKVYAFAEDLEIWRSICGGKWSVEEVHQKLEDQLNEIPWMNAGRCFHAKLRLQEFSWGRGVMFLTSYVQGKTGGPVNNDMLVLVVQGLTNDGKYAVNGRFEVRHPSLPLNSWDDRIRGKAVFSIDDETEKAEKWLNSQRDESFEPTMKRYAEWLDALRIGSSGR